VAVYVDKTLNIRTEDGGGVMSAELKDCMDCAHIRTEKKYDKFANSYRVNVCDISGVCLVWDDKLGIHNEANNCDVYKHYSKRDEVK